jgi:hypothetical protein
MRRATMQPAIAGCNFSKSLKRFAVKGSHRLCPFTWSCSDVMMSGTDTTTVNTWTVHLSAKLCFASSESATLNLLLPTRQWVDCPLYHWRRFYLTLALLPTY